MVQSAPYGSIRGLEAIDALMVATVFERPIALMYINDGVLHLIENQNGVAVDQKTANAPLKALSMYGLDCIYACDKSLKRRGLGETNLISGCTILTQSEMTALLDEYDVVISF